MNSPNVPLAITTLQPPLSVGDIPLMIRCHLDCMISSLGVAQRVASVMSTLAPDVLGSLQVHLYVETGMTRLGILPDAVSSALDAFKEGARVELVGVCTHFADADNSESDFTAQQLQAFSKALASVKSHPVYKSSTIDVHMSNSAALLDGQFHELLRKIGNAFVRPGCALYGFYPEVAHRAPEPVAAGESVTATRRVWVKNLELHASIQGQLEEALTFSAKVTNIIDVEVLAHALPRTLALAVPLRHYLTPWLADQMQCNVRPNPLLPETLTLLLSTQIYPTLTLTLTLILTLTVHFPFKLARYSSLLSGRTKRSSMPTKCQ